jgi:ubiquinone/menaquinone biosynthesis C-methylase UbiE
MHDSPEHAFYDGPDMLPIPEEVRYYYAQGKESTRLTKTPEGQVEYLRTKELLQRYLPPPPAVILDVGGGPGIYACWLASHGYAVHLVDPIELHVKRAQEASARQRAHPLASCELGDARHLTAESATVDAILLLGPLYHITERDERAFALSEAYRVLRPGGVIVAAGISKFMSALDGLSKGFVDDPAYREMMERDLIDGQHRNPFPEKTEYFTTSILHQPNELRREMASAGFTRLESLAVEGPAWLLDDLESYLDYSDRTAILMKVLRSLETEASLMGASKHFLTIGVK